MSHGFPPVIDYVSGALWRLFGKPEGGNLINPLAVLALALYVHLYNRVSMLWSIILFVAIPALHTALASQYVDLWTNSFFSLFLIASFNFLYRGYDTKHLLTAVVALAIAANSKTPFMVLAVPGLLGFAACSVAQIVGWHRTEGTYPIRRVLLVLLVGVPVVFGWAVANFVRFGNPVYPVSVRIMGYQLPGDYPYSADAFGPSDLRSAPNWEKWVLSTLEYRALSLRQGGYSLDQAAKPDGSEGDRMGGSAVFLWVPALVSLVAIIARMRRMREVVWPLGVMCLLTLAVMSMTGSFVLRYFTFVEITLLVAALSLLQHTSEQGDLYASGMLVTLKGSLVGAALFVSSVTGFRYIYPPALSVSTVTGWIRPELAKALAHSNILCYRRPDPNAILYSKLLNPDIQQEYTVISAMGDPTSCPAGSFIMGPMDNPTS